MNHVQLFILLACVGAASTASIFGQDSRDICGDPIVTQSMIDHPQQVIEYLTKLESNQKAHESIIKDNDFLRDLQSGKITKDRMKSFIMQSAYGLEGDVRSFSGAYNKFGFAYPVQETREFFHKLWMMNDEALKRVSVLGRKFDISSMEDLYMHDPNPVGMVWTMSLGEGVMHAQHYSEIVASMAIVVDDYEYLMQNIKKTIQTNAAYKSWGLTEDDLAFFDTFTMGKAELMSMVPPILKQGLRQEVTVCQLRRRLNNMNIGRVLYWKALSDEKMPGEGITTGF